MSRLVETYKVMIADDHAIFRDGLRRLLESESHIKVVSEASNGFEAFRLARLHRPDVLLLDMAMPRSNGLEVLTKLKEGEYDGKVLILTADIDQRQLEAALRLGARGMVRKESATQVLFAAIDAVMEGMYWVGCEQLSSIENFLKKEGTSRFASQQKFGLTKREMEIVPLIVAGCTNKDIAQQFTLSEDTVKHHLTNIFDKVGVSTRLELALFALHHKLVEAP
jgi:two-component system nitrate/nitrite response regulator NarL